MAVSAFNLLTKIKAELRIDDSADDDSRLATLIDEAVYSLQQFKDNEITDENLTPLDLRYIVIYIAIQYDGDDGLNPALAHVVERVRDK